MLRGWTKKLLLVIQLSVAGLFLTGLVVCWVGREGIKSPAGVPLAADLLKHLGAGVFVSEGRMLDLYRDSHLARWVHEAVEGEPAPSGAQGYDYVYPPWVAVVAAWGAGWPYLVWALGAQVLLVGAHAVAYVWMRGSGVVLDVRAWAAWWGLPLVYYNVIIGQNGGLSLMIFAGSGLLLARGFPLAAGLLAACTAYKPQLAPLLILFMAAAGQWRFAGGLAAGAAIWAGAGMLAAGWEAHALWLDAVRRMSSGEHPVMLELNPSVPGFVGVWGGRGVQGLVSLAGAVVLAWAGWRQRHEKDSARVLWAALAGLCVWAPYVMYYDLLLAAPMWLVQVREGGWRAQAGGVLFWLGALLSVNSVQAVANPGTPLLLAWWVLAVWSREEKARLAHAAQNG